MASPRSVGRSSIDAMERDERTVLFPRDTQTSRRRGGVDKCFLWTNLLTGVAFVALGMVIVSISSSTLSSWYKDAYLAGGLAEFIFGTCLLIRLVLLCVKFPGVSSPLRRTGDATSCLLFTALTLLFLIWAASVCSLLAAVIQSGLHIDGQSKEIALIVLSCVSLLLEFVFGGSVCFFVGCSVD